MVVAMERAQAAGLHNVFSWTAMPPCLSEFFAPGEVDRIYINFCDPWPRSNQKKRRLTHGNFLQLYRRVLPLGGEIHFKSDNDKLFEWSLERSPGSASGCPRSPGPSRRRPRGGHDGLRDQILPAGRHHQPVRGHHGSWEAPAEAEGEEA